MSFSPASHPRARRNKLNTAKAVNGIALITASRKPLYPGRNRCDDQSLTATPQPAWCRKCAVNISTTPGRQKPVAMVTQKTAVMTTGLPSRYSVIGSPPSQRARRRAPGWLDPGGRARAQAEPAWPRCPCWPACESPEIAGAPISIAARRHVVHCIGSVRAQFGQADERVLLIALVLLRKARQAAAGVGRRLVQLRQNHFGAAGDGGRGIGRQLLNRRPQGASARAQIFELHGGLPANAVTRILRIANDRRQDVIAKIADSQQRPHHAFRLARIRIGQRPTKQWCCLPSHCAELTEDRELLRTNFSTAHQRLREFVAAFRIDVHERARRGGASGSLGSSRTRSSAGTAACALRPVSRNAPAASKRRGWLRASASAQC